MFATVVIACLMTILIAFIGSIVYLVSLVINDTDEEGNHGPALGIDTHDFSSSPVASPNDNLLNYYDAVADNTLAHSQSNRTVDDENPRKNSAESSSSSNSAAGRLLEGECYCTIRQKALSLGLLRESCVNRNPTVSSNIIHTDIAAQTTQHDQQHERANAQELQSALLNSQILSLSERQRPISPHDDQSTWRSHMKTDSSKIEATGASFPSGGWRMSTDALKVLITAKLGAATCKQIFDDFDPKEMQLGGTGLHWCKTRRNLDRLIKLGVPLEARNKRNETAVHVAVRKHKLQILIGLLCQQANIEAKNDLGETPLILACKVTNIFACQLLLICDADFNAKDKQGLSARHCTSAICDRHMTAQQVPSAAHLILAMLEAIGARRCPEKSPLNLSELNCTKQTQSVINDATDKQAPMVSDKTATQTSIKLCADGCSSGGQYNGNSYNRWTDYGGEFLYKKHMFSDIIEAKKKEAKVSRVWRWNGHNKELKSRLLSIDGGGLRGVIVCQILIELQKYLKKPVISYFDWVGGTSVGAFIACALCQGRSLFELRKICFDVKDEVFNGQRPYNSKFIERVLKRTFTSHARMSDVKGMRLAVTTTLADRDPCQLRFFRNYKSPSQLLESQGFAPETFNTMSAHSFVAPRVARKDCPSVMGEKVVESGAAPKTATTSAPTVAAPKQFTEQLVGKESTIKSIIEDEVSESTIEDSGPSAAMSSIISENDTDPLVWQAVRASAAAPFFFKPYGPFLDGGIISNNPTLDMLNEFESYQRVRDFLSKRKSYSNTDEEPTSKLDLVVSLGTGRGRVIGRQAMVDFSQVASGFATLFSPVELVRSIRAARDLFKKLMQQSCHTEDHILDRAQAWCSSLGIPYFRINPPLATIFSIDDKRDEQLINALWQTKLYMRAKENQLRELAQILDSNN